MSDVFDDLIDIRPATPFPPQDAFVIDPSQFVGALCTRRAGKTNGFARRFERTMRRHPGCMCPYIALTRESAKNIMWPVLQELDDLHKWGARFTDSNLTMHLGGSKLQLFGADMKHFIRRLRGIKTPGAAVDEAQEFDSDHLENLIDNVLTPATADFVDGWIGLGGTPGPIPQGYFYRVTEEGADGYSVHRWSLYDNPFMPDPKGFVERLKKKKGWSDKHPTVLREYGGLWVLDLDSLLIRYDEKINNYEAIPQGVFTHVTGVDLGIKDADALATIGWQDYKKEIYLLKEEINSGDAISELAERLEKNIKAFGPIKLPTDEGALGKKIAEEIRRRWHIPLHAADKTRKMENVRLLNDYLRRGLFKAKRDSRFVKDSYRVQIDHEKSTPDKIVVKKGFHSDIIDAVLYAFKESPAFAESEKGTKPKYGTKEWAAQEVSDMEQAAVDHFTQLEQMEHENDPFGDTIPS